MDSWQVLDVIGRRDHSLRAKRGEERARWLGDRAEGVREAVDRLGNPQAPGVFTASGSLCCAGCCESAAS